MGMYHSTYFAYGARIPTPADTDVLEEALKRGPVGYLLAGDYDHDMTFLTTECESVDLGDFKTVTPQTATPEQYAIWNRDLEAAAKSLDISLPEAGWIVVPDLS
ncbi:hypothetical protein [Streptomyces scopuliridis]|uniref:Uncharacterized protein n=1 Tax=Streptomyces scopuliridis TaxID=452529 RepID=A0ACD4ZNV5_9ACTN|nr:hypothetical protein [Streptomyces scopuliridis]WSC00095.1 hypothetical protein OG835_25925 [Streptomyces scopuliridis]